jgi:hypothetical protein
MAASIVIYHAANGSRHIGVRPSIRQCRLLGFAEVLAMGE